MSRAPRSTVTRKKGRSKPALSSRWTTPALLTALANAAWGPLHGRQVGGCRLVLTALIHKLDFHSGEGLVTASQIADAAGMSERHTRTRLHILEDAGIITWRRGGVVGGRPQPGFIRIHKTVLVDLINEARPALKRVLDVRRKLTDARLAGLRRLNLKSPQRLRRSAHAELNGSPIPLQGGESSPTPPVRSSNAARKEIPECDTHIGYAGGRMSTGVLRCPVCRRIEAPPLAADTHALTEAEVITGLGNILDTVCTATVPEPL